MWSRAREDSAGWNEEHVTSLDWEKGPFTLWVWRKQEKEVASKKVGSWNSCLIASNFFEVGGKAGDGRSAEGVERLVWDVLLWGCSEPLW